MSFSTLPDVDLRRRTIIFLQDLARSVATATSVLVSLIENVSQNKTTKEMYNKIKTLDLEAREIKRNLINTLMKTGPILTGRDELIRLVSSLGAIIDFVEAAAYRAVNYKSFKKLPSPVMENIKSLSKSVAEIISSLRECVFLMASNPARVNDVGRRVIEKESEIDELYRTLELQLLNGDLEPSVVLSTLEVIRRIERASDEALNALDLVTILVMI